MAHLIDPRLFVVAQVKAGAVDLERQRPLDLAGQVVGATIPRRRSLSGCRLDTSWRGGSASSCASSFRQRDGMHDESPNGHACRTRHDSSEHAERLAVASLLDEPLPMQMRAGTDSMCLVFMERFHDTMLSSEIGGSGGSGSSEIGGSE
jgi:hypothetical protein